MVTRSGLGVARSITGRRAVRTAAMLVAGAFLLIGILGFIPGVTTRYDDLMFAGHESEAKLFGVFQVSILHNLVHLLFGLAGLVLARHSNGARLYLTVGGVAYLLLWIFGLAIDPHSSVNVIPLNSADNYLHLLLGLGMLILGLLLSPNQTGVAAEPDR